MVASQPPTQDGGTAAAAPPPPPPPPGPPVPRGPAARRGPGGPPPPPTPPPADGASSSHASLLRRCRGDAMRKLSIICTVSAGMLLIAGCAGPLGRPLGLGPGLDQFAVVVCNARGLAVAARLAFPSRSAPGHHGIEQPSHRSTSSGKALCRRRPF